MSLPDKHVVSGPVPVGRTIAQYTYANCLGNQCPRWRLASMTDYGALCSGKGNHDKCMLEHGITDCDRCPDRAGYCK